MEDDVDGRNKELRKVTIQDRRFSLLKMAGTKLSLILLILANVIFNVQAISYRCENNQILIVQNFGNDTIRMHCQRLNLCGNEKLKCNYDHEKATCGGKNNFVSHVNQLTPTGNVNHTCCELQNPEGNTNVPGHDGNDCFVYELPDGSSSSSSVNSAHAAEVSQNSDVDNSRRRRIHSIPNSEYTILQNAEQIPAQFDGYVGYRMKLFLLKNKSPPTLVVKAIERVVEGYRVTICRPRCGKFNREAEVVAVDEKAIEKPDEWAAASWSSWTSATWTTWSTTTWNATDEANGQGTARRNSSRIASASTSPNVKSDGIAGESGGAAAASANALANSTTNIIGVGGGNNHHGLGPAVAHSPAISEPPNPYDRNLVNNIHINATGGHSGGGGSAVGVGTGLPGQSQATAIGIKEPDGLDNNEKRDGAKKGNKIPKSDDNNEEGDEDDKDLLAKAKGKGKTNPNKNSENDENNSKPEDEEEDKDNKKPKKNKNGSIGKNAGKVDENDEKEKESSNYFTEKPSIDNKNKPAKKKLSERGDENGQDEHRKKGKPNGDNDKDDTNGDDDHDDNDHGNENGDKGQKGKNKGNPKKGAQGSNNKNKKDDDEDNEPKDLSNGENDSQKDSNKEDGKHKASKKKPKKGNNSGKGSPRGSFENSGEGEGVDEGDEKKPKQGKNKKDGEAKSVHHPNDRKEKIQSGKTGESDNKKPSEKNNNVKDNAENPAAKDSGDNRKPVKDDDHGNDKDGNEGPTASAGDHNNGKNNGARNGGDDNDEKKKVKLSPKPRKNSKEENNKENNKKEDNEKAGKEADNEGTKEGDEGARDGGKDSGKKSDKNGNNNKGHGKKGGNNGKNQKIDDKNGKAGGEPKVKANEKEHETGIDGDASGEAVNNSEKHEIPDGLDTTTISGATTPDEEAEDNNKELNPKDYDKNKKGKNEGNGDGDENNGLGNGGDNGDDEDDDNDDESDDDDDDDDDLKNDGGGNNSTATDKPEETDNNTAATDRPDETENNSAVTENADKSKDDKAKNPIKDNGDKSEKVAKTGENPLNKQKSNGADKGPENSGNKKKDLDNKKANSSEEDNGNDVSDDNGGVNGDNGKNGSNGDNSFTVNNQTSQTPTPDDEETTENVTDDSVSGEGLITVDLKAGLNAGNKKVEDTDDDGSGEEEGDDGSGEDSSGEGSGEGSGEVDGEELTVNNKLGGYSGEGGDSGERVSAGGGGGGVRAKPRPAARPVQQGKPTHTASGSRILRFQPMANADPAVLQRSCFSADTLVKTISGEKQMSELEVGDLVLVPASGNLLKFERVEMFYHREPETYVKFIQIETESGKFLSLTPLHLLPFGDCSELLIDDLNMESVQGWLRKSRFAYKATAGDCILSIDSTGNQLSVDKVTKVGRRYSKGIYSPMTVEGSIITNGVLSSCFSQIESHSVQKIAYDVIVYVYNAMGYMSSMAENRVQEIPSLLNYVHQFSRYVLPFAKY